MKKRKLTELGSVGPATVGDLKILGITSVEELIGRNPHELYQRLCSLTNTHHDICMLDIFCCAIAQAENPDLPDEQKRWFYWSKLRKN